MAEEIGKPLGVSSSMSENLAAAAERFVEHRRALGRKYISKEHELRLLVRFAEAHGIDDLDQLTAVALEMLLASRPRCRPPSFNHLLGVIRCFLDWTVIQEMLRRSPLEVRPRRVTAVRLPFIFDVAQARRLLTAAAALPDNSRARQHGPRIASSLLSAMDWICALERLAGYA